MMKFVKSSYFVIPFLVIFIYVPYIRIGNMHFFLGYLTFFLPWLILIKNQKIRIDKEAKIILYFILFSFFITLLTYIINLFDLVLPSLDIRGIKLHISIIFIFLSTYAIYTYLLKKKSTIQFLKIIYFSAVINIFTILLLYSSQAFADVFYSVIDVNPKTFTYAILRYPGLLYDGASYLSVFNAFIFMIGLVIFYEDKHSNFMSKTILFLIQMLIVISLIFIGRAGFVIIGVGLVLFFIYAVYTKQLSKKSKLYKTSYLITASSILAILALYIIDYLNMNWYIDWAFGFIINMFDGSGSTDSSVQELQNNHYFLPNGIFNIIFGLSDFQTTIYKTYSADPGYTIYIHGVGLIGLFAFLSFLFYILFFVAKNFSFNKPIAFLLIFIVISILIVNSKDFYIYYPYSHYILLFLLLFHFIDKVKECRNAIQN